jgi:hypothetical protein
VLIPPPDGPLFDFCRVNIQFWWFREALRLFQDQPDQRGIYNILPQTPVSEPATIELLGIALAGLWQIDGGEPFNQ